MAHGVSQSKYTSESTSKNSSEYISEKCSESTTTTSEAGLIRHFTISKQKPTKCATHSVIPASSTDHVEASLPTQVDPKLNLSLGG